MKNEYTPESWVILKVTSVEHGTHYRILAGWYGGFADSDYWKISSGIESITETDTAYIMPQTSGSTYICTKGCERMGMTMRGVLSSLQKSSEDPTYSVNEVAFSEMRDLV